MDLSFRPLVADRALDLRPADLATLVAAATARAAGRTTTVQAVLDAPASRPAGGHRLAPAPGSFDAQVAAALRQWRLDPPDGG